MIISHKHKFIYLAPPRTGSITVTLYLLDYFGAELGLKRGRPNKDACRVPVEFKDYFKFATIRNPYFRERTWYWQCGREQNLPCWEKALESHLKQVGFSLFYTLLQNDDYKPGKKYY